MKKHILFFLIYFLILLNTYSEVFSQNIDTEPSWVYYGRGNRYLHDKKLGYALAEYKKALKKINDDIKKTGKIDQYLPDVCFKIAQIYYYEGLYDASLFYVNIAKKNSTLFQIPDRIFSVLYLEADIFSSQNKMERALDVYKKIINMDNNWNSFKLLRSDQMPDFIISREKKAKFGPAYYHMGKIKYDNGNYDNAIVYLRMSFLYGYKLDTSSLLLKNCYKNIGMDFMIEKIDKLLLIASKQLNQ